MTQHGVTEALESNPFQGFTHIKTSGLPRKAYSRHSSDGSLDQRRATSSGVHVTSFGTTWIPIIISTPNPKTGPVCYSRVMRSGNTASLVNQPVGFCYSKKIDSRHHIVTFGASMSQFIQHQCDRRDRIHKSVTRLQVAANMRYVSI